MIGDIHSLLIWSNYLYKHSRLKGDVRHPVDRGISNHRIFQLSHINLINCSVTQHNRVIAHRKSFNSLAGNQDTILSLWLKLIMIILYVVTNLKQGGARSDSRQIIGIVYFIFAQSLLQFIFIMRSNSLKDIAPDYDLVLKSLKDVTDIKKGDRYDEEEDRMRMKLSQVFISCKKKTVVQIFAEKIKRGLIRRIPHPDFKERWQKIPNQTGRSGIRYGETFYNALLVAYILSLITLLIISSFCGFIDEFAAINSQYAGIIVTKALILLVLVTFFVVACTRKRFYKGEEKNYLKEIFLAYLKSYLIFFDVALIVLLILSLILPTITGISIAMFFVTVFHIFLARQHILHLQMHFLQTRKRRLIWNLVKVGFFNILFAHVLATILLGMAKYDPENNWLQSYQDGNFEFTNWFQIYVGAFYWATTIMMTVGFGDILPSTHEQMITVAFIEIFSCIVLAYNISEIGNIISTLRQKNERLQTKMAIFERILKRHRKNENEINPLLEKRIYNYINEEESDNNYEFLHEQEQLIESLPENLKMAYYREAYKPILAKLIFFRNLNAETQQEISQVMENRYYYPGKYFNKKDYGNIMILERGKVSLTYNKYGSSINGTPIDMLASADHQPPILISSNFLEFEKNQNYDIMADSHCHVWVLTEETFLNSIGKSKIDLQFYYSVLHKNKLYETSWDVVICPRCHNFRHTSFQCPKLHYLPLKTRVIEKFLQRKGEEQTRRYATRIRTRHKHTEVLQNRKQLIEISEEFYRNEAGELNVRSEEGGEKQRKQQVDKQREKFLVTRINQQKFRSLMFNAVRLYDIGYEEEYWDVEADICENYEFYFSECNPNRLRLSSMKSGLTPFFINPLKQYKIAEKKNKTMNQRIRKNNLT